MRNPSVNPPLAATLTDGLTEPESLRPEPESPRQPQPRADALDTVPIPAGYTPNVASQVTDPQSAGLPLGGSIKHYEFIRALGHGGMGTVYLARDTQLGRLVAIKLLAKHNPQLIKRFIAEARVTAQCSHENIVVIHETGVHQDHPYMVLQYLEGQTLRAWMKERSHDRSPGFRPISVHSAAELMLPVVRALVCAHQQGIVHRDLKPENIIITSSGVIKVLDFGIAKLLSSPEAEPAMHRAAGHSNHLTNPGAILGTLPYMSPEQLDGGAVDHRGDIWAVGIMLYELILGSHPLAPMTKAKLAQVIDLDEPMPSASAKAPELGPFGAVIDRCLIKNKADRCPSARTLLAELDALVAARSSAIASMDSAPFAGLAAFQEIDAGRFFGRDHEIISTVAQLRRQPLLALVGPSGAGKSSLVRAGVVPALKRSGEGWDAFMGRPGRQPLAALARILDDVESSLPSPGSRGSRRSVASQGGPARTGAERLRAEPGYLGVELRAYASTKQRRPLVFIDQFEELYTLGADADERKAFIACLEAAADDPTSPVRVIISVRSDFLDRVAEGDALTTAMSRGLMFLAPMTRDGLREALTRPLEAAEHSFESPELVERMLDALDARRGALPLLQFTASKLWELRDRDRRRLTVQSYQAVGGVAGALASHANTVLTGMSAPQQVLARKVFQRLVTPERTRAIVSMDELRELAESSGTTGEIERLVQHLAEMRLVVIESSGDAGGNLVELVHESLIDGWPMLAHWLDEDQENAVFLARLRTAAKQWHASGRTEGLLWRGDPAREAERWRMRYRGELSRLEREYIEATMGLENRAARRKRALIAGSMAFLVLLIVAGSVALFSIRRAEIEAKRQAAIVKQQLAELQNKETALRSKEQESRLAAERANTATRDAEMTKEQLRDALLKERVSKKEAERARDEALQAEQSARQAEESAHQAEKLVRQALERAERAAQAEREAKEDLQRFIGLGPRSTARGIRFTYKPRNTPREVYVAGTFNGWNPNNSFMLRDEDGDGIYRVTVPLSRGSYQYKFLVDGVWVKDPNAPMTESDGFGGLNGVFEVK